ncbi:MAG: hypothetical protein RI988_11 [Pseudomonadota bacterium]|jgi:DNA-binding SARP family transcriptional activator
MGEPAQAGPVVVLCGPPRLMVGNGAGIALERKPAALLCILAWTPDITRERLLSLLWPGVATQQAQTNLRVVRHRLTRAAGVNLWETGPAVQLARGIGCDLVDLRARAAHHLDPAAAEQLLAKPVLGGFSYPELDDFSAYLHRLRGVVRERALDALLQRAEALAADACLASEALRILARVGDERPTDERACRLAMRLLAARGERPAALVVYERCKRALSEDLGVGPSPATASLHRSILSSRDAAADQQPCGEPSAAALDAPPLVERDVLLPRVWLALRQGRIVWLTGAAGIGKSRMLAEALRALPGAWIVACRESDSTQPYASLARLVAAQPTGLGLDTPSGPGARALRTLSLLRSGDAARDRLDASQVLAALETLWRHAADQGVPAIALDDLHLIDRASAEVLHLWCEHVLDARYGAEPPKLPALILASRPQEHRAEAMRLMALLRGRDSLERLELEPLSRAGLHALVSGMGLAWLQGDAAADTLMRRSGGNPYLALEIIRESRWLAHPSRLEGQPVGVLEMLAARLERLEPVQQELAVLVAVASSDFSTAMADELLGLTPLAFARAWRSLERAGFLADRGMAHDLARQAVLLELSAGSLQLLQSRIADFLIRTEAPADAVATRLLAANRREAAYGYALTSVRQSSESFGLDEEALEMLDRVLGENPPWAPHAFELCEWRCRLTHWADGSVPDHAARMVAWARSADEHERAAVARAICLPWSAGETAHMRSSVEELLAAVPPASPHRMNLLSALNLSVYLMADAGWARLLGAELAELVRRQPGAVDALPMADLRRLSHGLLLGGQFALEAEEMRRQATRLRESNRVVDLYRLHVIVRASMDYAGHVSGWLRTSGALEGLRTRIAHRHRPSRLQSFVDMTMWVAAGDLVRASRALEPREGDDALEPNAHWARRVGQLLLWQAVGREDAFDAALAQPQVPAPVALSRRWRAWEAAVVAAEWECRGLDPRPAVESGRQLLGSGRSQVAMTLDLIHARSLEPEPALAVVQRVRSEALECGRLGVAASAVVHLAELELRLGRPHLAHRHARAALAAEGQHADHTIWRGGTLAALARVLDACDAEQAAALRVRYRTWLEEMVREFPLEWEPCLRRRWAWCEAPASLKRR